MCGCRIEDETPCVLRTQPSITITPGVCNARLKLANAQFCYRSCTYYCITKVEQLRSLIDTGIASTHTPDLHLTPSRSIGAQRKKKGAAWSPATSCSQSERTSIKSKASIAIIVDRGNDRHVIKAQRQGEKKKKRNASVSTSNPFLSLTHRPIRQIASNSALSISWYSATSANLLTLTHVLEKDAANSRDRGPLRRQPARYLRPRKAVQAWVVVYLSGTRTLTPSASVLSAMQLAT